MERTQTPNPHRGQQLKGNDTEWSRLRLERGMSLTELARASGLPRSIVGLICSGRLMPGPSEAEALLRVLRP
jgi:ribosome-binding protein aMBF1 (putative translation factor)